MRVEPHLVAYDHGGEHEAFQRLARAEDAPGGKDVPVEAVLHERQYRGQDDAHHCAQVGHDEEDASGHTHQDGHVDAGHGPQSHAVDHPQHQAHRDLPAHETGHAFGDLAGDVGSGSGVAPRDVERDPGDDAIPVTEEVEREDGQDGQVEDREHDAQAAGQGAAEEGLGREPEEAAGRGVRELVATFEIPDCDEAVHCVHDLAKAAGRNGSKPACKG